MEESRCTQCGRSVAGLDEHDRCAECGTPAIKALEPPSDHSPTASLVYQVPPIPPPKRRGDDALLGRELGGCRLISRIGGGGMGVVYRAEQLSLGRIVAVKLVRFANAAEQEFIARLQSEARVIAALDHPNILQVHDIGAQDGLHYIVMEYVDGPSLRAVMSGGLQRDPARCRSLLVQCLQGLGHAHSKDIIHRDLKPDNILVASGDRVKLADFGLAKALSSDQKLTSTGAVMGTPLYMSPEAARGERLDARSDLYSLGATFYHVLAGTPPFPGETPMGILYRQIHDPLLPLLSVNPMADPVSVPVVERLLAKSKSDRFQSCGEALAALDVVPGAWSGPVSALPLVPAEVYTPSHVGRPSPSVGASRDSNPTWPGPREAIPKLTSAPPSRPRQRLWLLLPLLALVLAALSPSGRRAIQSWQARQAQTTALQETPVPLESPGAPAEVQAMAISTGTLAGNAGASATPRPEPIRPSAPAVLTPPPVAREASSRPTPLVPPPDTGSVEAELRARCEAFLQHVLRREFVQTLGYVPHFDGPPPRPFALGARIRRVLRLPPLEQIEGFEIRKVEIGPSGEVGGTDVVLLLKPRASAERLDLRLYWRKEAGQWRLAPRGGR
jgi:serine/threonine protein kinase